MMVKLCITVAALAALAACAQAPTAQAQAESRERDTMAQVKAKYPDVVMGFDFKGNALDVSIDANSLVSMDEDAEDALKADAAKRWRAAWTEAHPGAHGTITLRLIDFRGTTYYKTAIRV